jgi:hypothetical protein
VDADDVAGDPGDGGDLLLLRGDLLRRLRRHLLTTSFWIGEFPAVAVSSTGYVTTVMVREDLRRGARSGRVDGDARAKSTGSQTGTRFG